MKQRCSKYFTRRPRPHGHVTYQIKWGMLHAYICVCMHACMGVWKFRSMYVCFHIYINVCAHACLYVHFCKIPPQVLNLASLAPPPPQYWKLPTHMSQAAILGSPSETQIILLSFLKVRKAAKISNRYTQVPHLTQDTHREVIKHNKSPHTREPRGQPFPSRRPHDCNK